MSMYSVSRPTRLRSPRTRLLVLLTLSWACPAAACDVSSPDGEELLRQGQRLIEQNCGDCLGSNGDSLLEGIKLVEAALARGVADQAVAHRALADGYATMVHVFAIPDSAEQKGFRQRQRHAWESFLAIEPRDVDALESYAFALREAEERAAVWRKILEIEPKHLQARASLGGHLVSVGRVEEGLLMARAAFEDAAGPAKREIGEQLLDLLLTLGRRKDADTLRAAIARLPRD